MNTPEKTHSRRAFAKLINKSETWLAMMAVRGTGPRFYRVGKTTLYRLSDWDAWLTANAVEPKAAP